MATSTRGTPASLIVPRRDGRHPARIAVTALVGVGVSVLAGCGPTGPAVAPPSAGSARPAVAPSFAASDGPAVAAPSARSAGAAATALAATLPLVRPTSRRPCVGAAVPKRYAHVIWIVMENKAIGSALSRSAPTTRAYGAACGIATAYHGVTHPSLPNYLAMTSGSTHGVTDDANPSAHRIAGRSIFSQATAARLGWATYAESMPTVCRPTSSGRYAVRHNPAVYYTPLASVCRHADVAMGTPTGGPLLRALRTGHLPGFTLMVPDLCSDTHDCSVAIGDRWLARWLAVILSSRLYAAGRTAVFVTWDEDDNSHANRVLLLMIAPSVRPHTVVRATYNHLNLLRTTEDMLGLPALVPRAASLRRPARI